MSFSIHGVAVARGVAVGRAVLVTSSRSDVRHYFIKTSEVEAEIARVGKARDAVVTELSRLLQTIPKDAPHELSALLEVHMMLLQDQELEAGVKLWISERLYNAEWALTSQLEIIVRQFDEMQDAYLRERKGDLEQVVERVLMHLRGDESALAQIAQKLAGQTSTETNSRQAQPQALGIYGKSDMPLILVAHDLSPADMLQFKQSVFAGFVTDVGGKTSHTAIVARSMDIPAVVGARTASQLICQDDVIIVDGDAGAIVVDPTQMVLTEYRFKQRQAELERERLQRLLHTPAQTLDDVKIELLANIEEPKDVNSAIAAGAVGVGLFRSEFLFMGRGGNLPKEEEQYQAYRKAVEGMHGMPVTIRSIDVGADKPLDDVVYDSAHANPALGLRAIRWCLAEPTMFLTQLRAILRAAAHGKLKLLIPMLTHLSEIKQTLKLIEKARKELDAQGLAYGNVEIGAMIEVPAAALQVHQFLAHFDYLSVGTNDLIQYTLAIDRADESVAHLYDPLHPAVLQLLTNVISASNEAGKPVSVCGEMAGDPSLTKLLIGLGLRSFSMHPSRVLQVKEQVLRIDCVKAKEFADAVLQSEDPAKLLGWN